MTSGSSPRVRGTPSKWRPHELPQRFIPACAGNAAPGIKFPLISPVHPRVCGERPYHPFKGTVDGSSPRVRGTRRPERQSPVREPVHPRVCGERWAEAE